MKKISGIIPLVMFSASVWATSPQTEDLTINTLEIDTRFTPAQVQIYTNEILPNPEECRLAHRYVFSLDNEGATAMLSVLLTAKATGQAVRFNTEGCQDGVPKVVISLTK